MSTHHHYSWSLCYDLLSKSSLAAYSIKWSQLTPWKYTPATPTDCAAAIHYVHNFCLYKQMLVSLNIFICIHVSISKEWKSTLHLRAKEWVNVFCCSYSRSRGETSKLPHRGVHTIRNTVVSEVFWAAVSQSNSQSPRNPAKGMTKWLP